MFCTYAESIGSASPIFKQLFIVHAHFIKCDVLKLWIKFCMKDIYCIDILQCLFIL